MLQRTVHITTRELKRLASIPVFYVVLFLIPLFVYIFYAYIYEKQYVRDIPVALWDEDQSALSRQLTDILEKTPSIKFVTVIHSEKELSEQILAGKISGAVHFPKDMEAHVKNTRPVTVTVFTNASSLVSAKMIYKDAAGVIVKAGLAVVMQKNKKLGLPQDQVNSLIQPIKLNTYTQYNTSYNYQTFLTPGLITVGMQMAIILIAVLLLNYELKTNTLQELIALAKGSASSIILGKTMALLIASWYLFVLVFFVVFPLFDLDKPGQNISIFILYNVLVLACIAIGILVSSIFSSYMTTADIALFYTSPAFVFSGFTFPRWAMPWYDQYYAAVMPYTYFLDAFVKIYYMELPLSAAWKELKALLIFIIIGFTAALVIYHFKLSKEKKHVEQAV